MGRRLRRKRAVVRDRRGIIRLAHQHQLRVSLRARSNGCWRCVELGLDGVITADPGHNQRCPDQRARRSPLAKTTVDSWTMCVTDSRYLLVVVCIFRKSTRIEGRDMAGKKVKDEVEGDAH